MAVEHCPPSAWNRVRHRVEYAVTALGAYYVVMGRAEATAFFRATIWGRAWIFVSFLALVVLGMAKPPLVLFGAVDVLGALWTWRALKTAA